jgi:lysophospholipase L1-like esterase
MHEFWKRRVTAGLGALLVSTAVLSAPQLTPFAATPPDLWNVAADSSGRVTRPSVDSPGNRFQWPGIYFETRFKGRSVYFRTGPGDVILHVLIDGEPVGTLVKPVPGIFRVDGLSAGQHRLRIEAVTESQAGSIVFGGFALPAGAKALPPKQRSREIEFIGDSHTVGYGNTSKSRDCTSDEVWATTDNSQAFGPKVAKHYAADYQINAISGRGVVRNYNGSPGDPLPVAYPFELFDHSTRYDGADWHPQIIVIALGTNDFSTPLNAGEKWATHADLRADYEATYVKFLEDLRARNRDAFIIVWATGKADQEIPMEAARVVAQIQAQGESRIAFVAIGELEMTGCHWHPSLADHDAIAARLIQAIDERRLVLPRY